MLKPNGRYVMLGGQEGNWIKPMDRAAAIRLKTVEPPDWKVRI